MHSPHIAYLIHDQNPIAITGIQHGLAQRMMGTTDAVESSFFQLPAATLICPFQRDSTKDSIVIMDACPPKLHFFSVQPQAMCSVQKERADSKVLK